MDDSDVEIASMTDDEVVSNILRYVEKNEWSKVRKLAKEADERSINVRIIHPDNRIQDVETL